MATLEGFLGVRLVRKAYATLLVAGASLGVATVLIVLSLFLNYERGTLNSLVGAAPHLVIRAADPVALEAVSARLRRGVHANQIELLLPAIYSEIRLRLAAVRRVSIPCYSGTSLACRDPGFLAPPDVPRRGGWVETAARVARVRVRGVAVEAGETAAQLDPLMASAQGLDRLDAPGLPPAVIVEESLLPGLAPLDDLLISIPGRDARVPATVLGTLGLGLAAGPVPLLVTSRSLARELAGGRHEEVLEVRLRDPRQSESIAAAWRSDLGSAVEVRTWQEESGGAADLLAILRVVLSLVAASVILIAALGVVSTLTLVVTENTPKIALLRSLGLRDASIYLLFAFRCLGIASAGLLVGLAGGWSATHLLLRLGPVRTAFQRLGVLAPEPLMQPSDILALALGTLLLFLATAVIPARAACRLDVVKGLQT